MRRVFFILILISAIIPSTSWGKPKRASSRHRASHARFQACMDGLEENGVPVEPPDPEFTPKVEQPSPPTEEELAYFQNYGWLIKKDRGFVNNAPFPVTLVQMEKYGGYPVEIKTAIAFDKMAKEARKRGITLLLNSGFRTHEQQIKLRKEWCSRRRKAIAAVPGRSLHQAGYALDINVRERGSLRWLNKHASEFQFYRTVCSEPWHWEYSPSGENLPMHYGCFGKRAKARLKKTQDVGSHRSELASKQMKARAKKNST